ncbi:translation initiation factor eIF-2B [Nitrosophilus alvini]|uniref:translation initiation factor eIF-2B n=1 Tax=Nitrosophilus alvini TaxID=2714855 RepID=UPI00190C3E89|nr:translation initiation factor eIF-2B [Nitrosophilus alvini]
MHNLENFLSFEIGKIKSDNLHGASYLTKKCAELIIFLAKKDTKPDILQKAAVKLAGARPMMASIFSFANSLLFLLDKHPKKEKIISFCNEFIKKYNQAAQTSSSNGAELISSGDTLLTHSFSSIVFDALKRAKYSGKDFKVICTESRPACEGVKLAEELCKIGIKTTLITDAAAPFMTKKISFVLIGADGTGNFGLVHKIGTYGIALCAKDNGKKVISLSTSQKFWPYSLKPPLEPLKNRNEIVNNDCLDVINIYFDFTPLHLIDAISTENGFLGADEVQKLCKKIEIHTLLKDKYADRF